MWSCFLLFLCEASSRVVRGERKKVCLSNYCSGFISSPFNTRTFTCTPPISRSFFHAHHSLSHVWSSIFSTTPAAPRGATTQRCLPSLAFYSFVSPPPSRSAAVTISPSIFAMFGNCARTAARCSAFSIPS